MVNILKSISVENILMGGNIPKDIDKTTNTPIHQQREAEPRLPSRQIFSLLARGAERVNGANVTWEILLLISTGESIAAVYLH